MDLIDEDAMEISPKFAGDILRQRSVLTKNQSCSPLRSSTFKHKSIGVGLKRSFSESQASNIKQALHIQSQDPTLIADCSKPYALPTLKVSKHRDLRSISHTTLADLMNGVYKETIHKFTIIDCRFPYEFEGGHIQNAVNIFTQEDILKEFISNQENMPVRSTNREILIFHCEFSSERGPSLYRFLRNTDRTENFSSYPSLHYPEIYLLEGGYKDFFINHKELCAPEMYVPMHSKQFDDEHKKYRQIMKANSFDPKNTVIKQRTSNLRLR